MTDDTNDDTQTEVADETPDAADPVSIKHFRRKAKITDENRSGFWKRTLADPIGRLVVWEMLIEMGSFGEPFVMTPAGMAAEHAMFFKMGIQHFGRRLYQRLLRIDRLAVCAMHDEFDPEWQVHKPKRAKRT